jgi:alpha-mannosidase
MIGNAHIDPVWLWRWPEGCAEAISTCWAAVELIDEQPTLIFTRGEAALYRWIEELDPALFARIRQLVQAGRWSIVNGWWLQPDCNLPDGESFIRQALYGKRFFRERFGVDVTVGYNVDSFGHAATLPMLLHHTGFAHYVFMRPMEHEHALPSSLFDWVAPDGSRVSAFRLPFSYNSPGSVPDMQRRLEQLASLARQEGTPLMGFYGVGNHGGGPTRQDVTAIMRAQGEGLDLAFSDPLLYFTSVAGLARPEIHDDLQIHAIGCYSAISSLKALNRQAEAHLAQAEAASALARLHAGAAYPHATLRSLWETLLFNQFHDILCGSSVESATRDAEQALGSVVHGAQQLLHAALRRLAATVVPSPSRTEREFLVFNLSGAEQHAALEYEPWTGWETAACQLLDDQGGIVPHQELHAENYTHPGVHRVLFAPRVPAFGYRLYRAVKAVSAPAYQSGLRASTSALESAAWRLELDPVTGSIGSLVDKRAGRVLFSSTAHQPLIVEDDSDTWSHELDRFGFQGISFAGDQVEMLEAGPLRASLRVRARAGASTVTSTYLLYDDPGQPLEIRVTVDWHEQHRLLRLCYPMALPATTFRYEVPYGSVERKDDGREWPGQRWVLASGSDGYAVVLANDAKYSYASLDGALYITALRSPVYAHHKPVQLDPRGAYPFTDQGEQRFVIRLLAGQAVGPSEAHRLADDLLRPPVAIPHVTRGGAGPRRAGLLEVQTASSSVTWLKVAEDGSDVILRLVEHEGKADTVVLPASGDRFTISPWGILTLRRDDTGRWRQCDGLENARSIV